MVKPVSTENSAATPAVVAQVKTNGRLIQPLKLKLNIDTAKSIFNAPLRSENVVARGAEKTARATAAAVVALFEILGHIVADAFKFVANMVIRPYVAFRDRNAGKEEAKPVEVEMAPVTTPTAEQARNLEEQPVVAKAETPAQPQPAHSNIWQTIRANPGKTALAVAGLFVTGGAAYYYAPVIASTISSWMSGASSASNFSNFSQFSNFSNFAGSNFAGSNFGGTFVV